MLSLFEKLFMRIASILWFFVYLLVMTIDWIVLKIKKQKPYVSLGAAQVKKRDPKEIFTFPSKFPIKSEKKSNAETRIAP